MINRTAITTFIIPRIIPALALPLVLPAFIANLLRMIEAIPTGAGKQQVQRRSEIIPITSDAVAFPSSG